MHCPFSNCLKCLCTEIYTGQRFCQKFSIHIYGVNRYGVFLKFVCCFLKRLFEADGRNLVGFQCNQRTFCYSYSPLFHIFLWFFVVFATFSPFSLRYNNHYHAPTLPSQYTPRPIKLIALLGSISIIPW